MRYARTLAAALIAATALPATSLATAAPASAAARYHCKTSHRTVRPHSGDGWDFTARLCAKRVGSHAFATAKLTWDGPYDLSHVKAFDFFSLQMKRQRKGPDKTLRFRWFDYGFNNALQHSSRWGGNGSYETGTIKIKASRHHRYRADGYIAFEVKDRNIMVRTPFKFAASPAV